MLPPHLAPTIRRAIRRPAHPGTHAPRDSARQTAYTASARSKADAPRSPAADRLALLANCAQIESLATFPTTPPQEIHPAPRFLSIAGHTPSANHRISKPFYHSSSQ